MPAVSLYSKIRVQHGGEDRCSRSDRERNAHRLATTNRLFPREPRAGRGKARTGEGKGEKRLGERTLSFHRLLITGVARRPMNPGKYKAKGEGWDMEKKNGVLRFRKTCLASDLSWLNRGFQSGRRGQLTKRSSLKSFCVMTLTGSLAEETTSTTKQKSV